MMLHEVDISKREINFLARGIEEVIQNVRIILTTPKGSLLLDRDFGIDTSLLDLPIELAENLLTSQIFDAVKKYEPRANIQKVRYTKNHLEGTLSPIVTMEVEL